MAGTTEELSVELTALHGVKHPHPSHPVSRISLHDPAYDLDRSQKLTTPSFHESYPSIRPFFSLDFCTALSLSLSLFPWAVELQVLALA